MGVHDKQSLEILYDLDLNSRWIATEVIHSVNNFLGGIEYSIHFIREDPENELEPNLEAIQDRVKPISKILRSLYELQNPMVIDRQIAYAGLFERVRSLLTKQILSQKIGFSISADEHLRVPVKMERFISQLLFTYLWLRFKHIENPCSFQLSAVEEQGEIWISVEDDSLVDPAISRVQSELKNGEPSHFETRKEFAKHCLGRFFHYLNEKGCNPVLENGVFKFQSFQELQ